MSDLTAVSLFAGVGGFDKALQGAGIRTVAAVEIDSDCRAVLRRHFPGTAIFSDVKEVTGDQLRAAGFVPERGVLCAGWPCQGNSVAGRRKGMADPRSGLWRHVVRLLAEARPRWFIGENVPGLLSINGGRDFGTVIRDLDELGYGVAWRVLDAQFFGVPQRRRRVFVAGCLGDPAGPVKVLLEPEGGDGNPAPGETARAGTAGTPGGDIDGPRTVGTLGTSGPGGGWRIGPDEAAAGQLVAATLQGGGRRGHRVDAEGAAGGHLIPLQVAHAVTAREGKGADSNVTSGNIVAHALTSRQQRQDGTVETLVAHPVTSREAKQSADSDATNGLIVTHALTSEGADASEDGTGRGTPLVAVPVAWHGRGMEAGEEGVANTIRSGGDGHTGDQMGYVMTQAANAAVRRLTPLECERLQGFPDDWSRWQDDGTEQSDSARYRQLGNAVAVPVVQWIAERVADVEAAAEAGEVA